MGRWLTQDKETREPSAGKNWCCFFSGKGARAKKRLAGAALRGSGNLGLMQVAR